MYNPCLCGHDYDQHAYSTQAPCTAEGCGCPRFSPDNEAERRMVEALSEDVDDATAPGGGATETGG